jgi:uncharacterized protein DUF6763
MKIDVGGARIGQWYTHLDKGEAFLVTGYDEKSRTIETQAINGDLDEIDEESWSVLPLELAEPPEDWTESEDADTEDSEISIAAKILSSGDDAAASR